MTCKHKPTHPQYPVYGTRGWCQHCRLKVIYDGHVWTEDQQTNPTKEQPNK